jgi:hypothetical protein
MKTPLQPSPAAGLGELKRFSIFERIYSFLQRNCTAAAKGSPDGKIIEARSRAVENGKTWVLVCFPKLNVTFQQRKSRNLHAIVNKAVALYLQGLQPFS